MTVENAAYCLVSFHAHPDDEAILTAGSLAKAAAAGHRVVLVMATRGERGLAATPDGPESLSELRWRELLESAGAIGCARVEWLGYEDSGSISDETCTEHAFSTADLEQAALRLATILREEGADVLTTYDANGGYGHPDHIQVHYVGARAAEIAETPVLLEATINRDPLCASVRWLRRLRFLAPGLDLPDFSDRFSSPTALTHRIDVRQHIDRKRRAIAAHATQTTGGEGQRTLRFFLRLPRPIFARVFGYEWFIESGRLPNVKLADDMFLTLQQPELSKC